MAGGHCDFDGSMPPALTPHEKAMLPCHGDMVALYTALVVAVHGVRSAPCGVLGGFTGPVAVWVCSSLLL